MAEKMKDWDMRNDNLTFGRMVPKGSGRFADIKFGTLRTAEGETTVAVKLNKCDAPEKDRLLMTDKMNLLDMMPKHENLLKIIAAIQPPQGPMIVMEFCEDGKLSDWLVRLKDITEAVEDQMQDFCRQVAAGMCHLHDNQILHKRLGVRNILLTHDHTGKYVAKLTGFGPLKDEQEENKKGDRIPLRWMAPEQCTRILGRERVYTKETDVWSYGILVHEVYAKGEMPYLAILDDDLKTEIRNGYRMERPTKCPAFMYDDVMMPCWSYHRKDRPDFGSIIIILKTHSDGEADQADDIYVTDQPVDFAKFLQRP